MAELLLQTKLHVPVTRSQLVPRPQLTARLNAGLNGRLTLVSAPAGFGKTTLIAHWGQQLAAAGNWQFTWLALDGNDNDVGRFFTYFIAALQRTDGRLAQTTLELLQSTQVSNTQLLLTDLVNNLTESNQAVVLVLDDYHLITNPAIHDGIVFLIDHAPPHFHLLLISRADPPFSLVRWRAQHQVTEIRQDSLRFSRREAGSFLNELMALDLPGPAVAALEKRTEGWVAGLQMAALSLQGRSDSDRFIADFAASHRYIFDYLAEEVLARRPPGTRDFLLHTGLLDRLCAPLCDALLETAEFPAQQILQQLENANLFLIPLDDERRWYRYHHLFADLLRQFLRREQPEQEALLHSRASRWFEDAGYLDEAVHHALAAIDYERAAALIVANAPVWYGSGRFSTLNTWLDSFPDGFIRARPRLALVAGWGLVSQVQPEAAEKRLQQAWVLLEDSPESVETDAVRGEIAHIRLTIAYMTSQFERVPELAEQALTYLPADNVFHRGATLGALGDVYRLQGRIGDAYQVIEQSIALSRKANNPYGLILGQVLLAKVMLLEGKVEQARPLLVSALSRAEEVEMAMPAHMAHALLAQVHYWSGDLESAAEHAHQGLPQDPTSQFDEDTLEAAAILTEILHQRGEKETAAEVLHQAASQLHQPVGRYCRRRLASLWARHHLLKGDLTAVTEWARQLPGPDEFAPLYLQEQLLLARLYETQGQLAQARQVLTKQEQVALAAGWGSWVSVIEQRRRSTPLAAPMPPPPDILSPREMEVLQLIAQGLTNKAIAARLFIAPGTAKRHTINIYNKLAVNSRAEATARAYELGLIQPD
ncbi:MAG: LuxR C-terminal-related transcriptional regulator [Candidatus Promineifilaceae bacterium]|nr:LuxR C-terminal-related transcriptional regulator [Candidatus Promineifilaceae bacterium]